MLVLTIAWLKRNVEFLKKQKEPNGAHLEEKIKGPKLVPWGTPQVTDSDKKITNLNRCFFFYYLHKFFYLHKFT